MSLHPLRSMTGRLPASLVAAMAVLLTPVATSAWANPETAATQTVRIEGTVALADGSPAVGGSICLANRAVLWPVQDGQFELDVSNLQPGDYDITYTKDNVGIARVIHVSAGQQDVEVSLQVGEQPAVQGRVVSDDLPEGFPGAEITIRGEILPGRDLQCKLYAGEDGIFLLDGAALEGCRIQASVPYHRASDWLEVTPPFPMWVTLRVQPDTVILGRVVSADGNQPVANAVVAFGTQHTHGSTTTDEQGHFQLTGLEAGDCWLAAYARMFRREGIMVRLQEGHQVIGLVIRLSPMAVFPVLGRVLGPDGKAGVAGAKLSFRQGMSFGVPEIVYSAVTDESGHYFLRLPVPRVRGEPTEPWSVEVEAEGCLGSTYWVHLDPAAVRAGESAPVFDFQVFRGGRLSGVVLPGPTGGLQQAALAELLARVETLGGPPSGDSWASSHATVSSETGRFDFGLVAPGEHTLVIRSRAFREIFRAKVMVKEGEATELRAPLPR